MIADVLDDSENIHIDKTRFGVAFLLVQPLDVAVSEFDFEAAQLPGDGGDFARLVGVVVDEAVQRGLGAREHVARDEADAVALLLFLLSGGGTPPSQEVAQQTETPLPSAAMPSAVPETASAMPSNVAEASC